MTTGAGRSGQTQAEAKEKSDITLLVEIEKQLKIIVAQNNEVHDLNMNETDVRGK